jgi:hypothetical protein
MIEDLQAVMIDVLIEDGMHRYYLAEILDQLPPNQAAQLSEIAEREAQYAEYLTARIRQAVAILSEGRPGPTAYDPDRPARRISRPVEALLNGWMPA